MKEDNITFAKEFGIGGVGIVLYFLSLKYVDSWWLLVAWPLGLWLVCLVIGLFAPKRIIQPRAAQNALKAFIAVTLLFALLLSTQEWQWLAITASAIVCWISLLLVEQRGRKLADQPSKESIHESA